MADFTSGSPYHRKISTHNADEIEKVRLSMEVWGREAHTLAGGRCVQAYPGFHTGPRAYSFGTDIPPVLKFGFRGRVMVVREVAWYENMDGVETRELGEFACIPILWMTEEVQNG